MVQFLQRGYHVETSYLVAKGINPAVLSWFELLRAYIKISYENWHFVKLRRWPDHPKAIYRIALLEKLIRAPLAFFLSNEDRRKYVKDDFIVKRAVADVGAVEALSSFAFAQEKYYDIYQGSYEQIGMNAKSSPATLYIKTLDFVRSEAFWDLITTPALFETCTNVLGPKAHITWAWLWHSKPSTHPYQNQNWHRDTGEPFNFIRVFFTLTDVRSVEDGPTMIAKGTSRKPFLFERRRFTEEEVLEHVPEEDLLPAFAEKGDIYFANTYCLHRGLPPVHHRSMLSLLISYQNSYRTKGLPLVPFSELTDRQQKFRGCPR